MLLFGLPLVFGLAAHSLFVLVDTLLVGQLGENIGAASIAVTGLCDPLTTFQTIVFNGPVAGAGLLIAARFGAKDDEALRRVVLQATGFVVLLSLAVAVPGFLFAEEIAMAMGATDGWQLERCTEYLQVMLGLGITAGLFLYLTTVERSIGRTGIFMAFFILSNVLNLVLGLLLIYGTGPYPEFLPGWFRAISEALGVPRLGVLGSAWSTVLARGISVLLLLALGIRRGHLRGALRWLLPRGDTLASLVRIGFWSNGQIAVRGLVGGVLIRVVQHVSHGKPEVVAGVFVGMKIELMLLLLAFGWGSAAQTLVATSLGAGKPRRSWIEERLTIYYAAGLSVLLVVPLFIWAREIATVFNPSPELVEWSALYIRISALSFLCMPVYVVISLSLVARGVLKAGVMMDAAILLGILVPLLAVMAFVGGGLTAVLIVNASAYLLVTACFLALRTRIRSRQSRGNGAADPRAATVEPKRSSNS